MKKDAVCIFMSATFKSSGTIHPVTFVPGASQHLSYSRQSFRTQSIKPMLNTTLLEDYLFKSKVLKVQYTVRSYRLYYN